jgi:hypothetical protein
MLDYTVILFASVFVVELLPQTPHAVRPQKKIVGIAFVWFRHTCISSYALARGFFLAGLAFFFAMSARSLGGVASMRRAISSSGIGASSVLRGCALFMVEFHYG